MVSRETVISKAKELLEEVKNLELPVPDGPFPVPGRIGKTTCKDSIELPVQRMLEDLIEVLSARPPSR